MSRAESTRILLPGCHALHGVRSTVHLAFGSSFSSGIYSSGTWGVGVFSILFLLLFFCNQGNRLFWHGVGLFGLGGLAPVRIRGGRQEGFAWWTVLRIFRYIRGESCSRFDRLGFRSQLVGPLDAVPCE